SDQCNEGVTICNGAGTGTACSDTTGGNPERCNDADDDCDGSTDEGFSLGVACDGADSDVCKEGAMVCAPSGLASICDDTSGDDVELCNDMDDDCDGSTDEGAGAACG